MRRVRLSAVLLTLAAAGCPSGGNPAKPATKAKGDTKAKPDAKAKPATNAKPDAKAKPDANATPKPAGSGAKPDGPLGKVLADAPIALDKFFGSAPPTAETFLGPAEENSKGGTKETCVRYLPDRTWFKCAQAWQRYGDKTGTAQALQVTYEEGKAVSLILEKLGGDGPFDPVAALNKAGLELPGKPKLSRPAEGVKLWSWWNSQARLLFGGRQYRVEVSTINDSWESSKVEIILNDPLSDDEKTRVIEVKAQREAAEGEPEAG